VNTTINSATPAAEVTNDTAELLADLHSLPTHFVNTGVIERLVAQLTEKDLALTVAEKSLAAATQVLGDIRELPLGHFGSGNYGYDAVRVDELLETLDGEALAAYNDRIARAAREAMRADAAAAAERLALIQPGSIATAIRNLPASAVEMH